MIAMGLAQALAPVLVFRPTAKQKNLPPKRRQLVEPYIVLLKKLSKFYQYLLLMIQGLRIYTLLSARVMYHRVCDHI